MVVSKKRQSRTGALLARAHALHQQNQLGQAAKQYKKLLELDPEHVDGLSLYGLLRLQQGRLEEASELLERATQAGPDLELTWLRYGELQLRLRNLEGALHAFEQILRIDPESINGLFAMANLSYTLERYDDADLYYLQALAKDPANSKAWANLSRLAQVKGQRARAIQTASAALDCPEPDPFAISIWLEAHLLIKPAAELARRAQELLEHPAASGEVLAGGLFVAQHVNGLPAQVLLRARDRVQQQIAAAVGGGFDKQDLNARPRPRTLGFLSSAFHQHPVAFMVLGALEHLAEQGFRIHIYSGRSKGDAYTERFRRCAHEWHDIWQMSDAEVVERIREDGVDVLFDLSGTSNFGRPYIPAMRAAPLQVKWVGGQSGPSGIPNMDAFLSDAVQSPPWADQDHRERLLRMPHGYVTYTPPLDAPEPALEPPARRNGYITFGSLNKLNKLGVELLRVWAQILNQVPNSRLLLRAEGANEEVVQNMVIEVMEAAGVARERLSFEGRAGHREFLETYNRIDIALDSFPYTGGLTTCEALWMGVPVVALAGRFVAERHAATHLHNVGLSEWVANNLDEYVEKAVALAQDQEHSSRYRQELRAQVANSPLCDHEGFAADLAKLIREEWTRRFGEAAEDVEEPQEPGLQAPGPAPSLAHAKALFEQGDLAGAFDECTRLVESGECTAEVLELAGMAANASGHKESAVNMLRMALSIEPNRESALTALVQIVESAS